MIEQKLKEFRKHIFNKTFSRDGKIYWDEVETFLGKALEEQEKEFVKATMTHIKQVERFKADIIELNDTLQHLRQLNAKDRREYNKEDIINIILEQECYDGTKGHAPALGTADLIIAVQGENLND